jgi:hypothetical protein
MWLSARLRTCFAPEGVLAAHLSESIVRQRVKVSHRKVWPTLSAGSVDKLFTHWKCGALESALEAGRQSS